jgi:hypothetical protein
LNTKSLESNSTIVKSIFANQDRDLFTSLSHQEGFIPRFLRGEKEGLAIAHDWLRGLLSFVPSA